MARTRDEGSSAGEIVRGFLEWWLRRPGAKLPPRPRASADAERTDQPIG